MKKAKTVLFVPGSNIAGLFQAGG